MEARVFNCNIQALYDKLFCSLTVHCVKNNLVGGGRLHIPVFLIIAFIHEGLKETVNNQCLQAFCATLGFGFFCLFVFWTNIFFPSHPSYLFPYLAS